MNTIYLLNKIEIGTILFKLFNSPILYFIDVLLKIIRVFDIILDYLFVLLDCDSNQFKNGPV